MCFLQLWKDHCPSTFVEDLELSHKSKVMKKEDINKEDRWTVSQPNRSIEHKSQGKQNEVVQKLLQLQPVTHLDMSDLHVETLLIYGEQSVFNQRKKSIILFSFTMASHCDARKVHEKSETSATVEKATRHEGCPDKLSTARPEHKIYVTSSKHALKCTDSSLVC